MNRSLSIRVVHRAAVQIREARKWWSEHYSDDAVVASIEWAFAYLSELPDMGERARNSKLKGVRRLYLQRIRHHLYYRILDDEGYIEVLALWHTSRDAEPTL